MGTQGAMYDNLIRRDPRDSGQTIIPDLAHSWEIAQDGKTYTFFLRKGVKFHDGGDFTAEDVKATYQRIIFPPQGFSSPRTPLFSTVEAINVRDPRGVFDEVREVRRTLLAVSTHVHDSTSRRSSVNASVMVNFLNSDVSRLTRPGPRNDPRATLPKVPGVGIRKALGSNHWSGLPKITGPLKFGFQLGTSDWLESPVPEGLEPTKGVKGNPPCQLKISFHCQPPTKWFFNPLAPPANRCPLPNGN